MENKEYILSNAFYKSLRTVNNLILDSDIPLTKIQKRIVKEGINSQWNIIEYSFTTELELGTLGKAYYYPNNIADNLDYLGKIEITEELIDNEGYLLNTLIHEILHIAASQIMEDDQGHEGMWLQLAEVYNQKYPENIPILEKFDYERYSRNKV